MKRRDLIRPLAAIPAIVLPSIRKYEVSEKGKFVVLIDGDQINADDFCKGTSLPAGTPVYVVYGDIDNAIRIFKVSDE